MSAKSLQFTAYFSKLPSTVQQVVKQIIETAQPESIILFGSRARGDHRGNSDFDFCIKGRKSSNENWNRWLVDFQEKSLSLFSVDIVEMEKLNKDYLASVKKEGIKIYG